MTRIAIALAEKGHEVNFVSIDCKRGRTSLPKMLDGTGVKLHLTPTEGNLEVEDSMADMTADRKLPNCEFYCAWDKNAIKLIKEINPDIVVNDLLSQSGMRAAEQLGIPFVLNNPAGTLSFWTHGGLLNLAIDHNYESSSWFG